MGSYSPARLVQLLAGCVVVGVGVAMLLAADLGSDGYSTLINGVARSLDISFWVANLGVGVILLLLAAARGVYPGPGTVVQVGVVGVTVSALLDIIQTPVGLVGQAALLAAALPVLAVGIAAYLGSHTGAGPAEAAALAWDPPVPFRWSYGIVQGGGALGGWLLGGTLGAGTIAVILLLGPSVDLASRLLHLDVHQHPVSDHPAHPRSLLARWQRLTDGLPTEVAHVLTAVVLCAATTGIGYLVGGLEGAVGGCFIGIGLYALGWLVYAVIAVVVVLTSAVRWWRSRRT